MTDKHGQITVTFSEGKKSVGYGTLKDWDVDGMPAYFDYSDKPYPSKIDMKKATGVSFKPDIGKEIEFSSWEYFFTGGWKAPRLLVT